VKPSAKKRQKSSKKRLWLALPATLSNSRSPLGGKSTVGTLLMLLLIFGSALTQEYQALSTLMIAVAFYLGLPQQFATIGFPCTAYDSANGRACSLHRTSVRLWIGSTALYEKSYVRNFEQAIPGSISGANYSAIVTNSA
jgi:hypothetical protein